MIFDFVERFLTSANTHFAAPLPSVATPIFGAGVALRAKIVPAPNIAKCGTLGAIPFLREMLLTIQPMGIESGGDSPTKPDREAEIARRLSMWQLDTDARTVFARLDFAVSKGGRGEQFSVEPLPHYRDYLVRRAGTTAEEVELTMRLSVPEAVAAFDHVVDEFNADIERINREQDFEAVRHFETRGFDVFKQRS